MSDAPCPRVLLIGAGGERSRVVAGRAARGFLRGMETRRAGQVHKVV